MFKLSELCQIFVKFIKRVFHSRTTVISIMFCLLSFALVQRAFVLQIVNGQNYVDKYELQIEKIKKIEGTRGRIRDRNGVLLAYNELAYAVTIEDTGEYNDKELNDIIMRVIDIVEKNGDVVINKFGIILEGNRFVFATENETQRLRFIADIFGKPYIEDLTYTEKNRSAEDIINYLCHDKTYGYGIDTSKLSKKNILSLINVRYSLSLNSFQKFIATTISEGVSQKTVADISENLDTLGGIKVEEKSLRKYVDSQCFANIIGYTGQISSEEYQSLSAKEKADYDLTDTIGKAGIEKRMDSQLKGKKGEEKIYVNNVGKVIDVVDEVGAQAGNDVYLTLDYELQKAAYNIIEQELAGILLSKLVNSPDYDRTQVSDTDDLMIPIGDAYDNLIYNEVINIDTFADEDAGSTEREVYEMFTNEKSSVMTALFQHISGSDTTVFSELQKDMQAYQFYVVSQLLTTETGLILADKIDTESETYTAWNVDETTDIYSYLNYLISANCIDTNKLIDFIDGNAEYTDSEEIYKALVSFISDSLDNNKNFDKLVYRYLIRSGRLSGQKICMILYEQEVLAFDEDQYNRLSSGSLDAYDFVRGKIETLDLTPGELGLEPCTGSLVMTDIHTGEVLACVSYPGYDNNFLANNMNSSYFSKLLTNKSRPFFNNATQERTAPGSTYKPMIAVAALTEGVIDAGTTLPCDGVYKKVEPNPKCWAYPNGHGYLDIVGAIEHSCNCFFYETGYRMSLDSSGMSTIGEDNEAGDATNVYYSSNLGTDTIEKYAVQFGLGEKSGIEINEEEPKISDSFSVPTAIGQGTNNYTTSQLARYTATIATKGTLFDLTLLKKTTDSEGSLIEEFSSKSVQNFPDVSESTWNSVHNGMRNVISGAHSLSFTRLNQTNLMLSGKTGTAEQSKVNANHALFIGYAPSDNPDVAFSIRIANGYSSTYTCEIAENLMLYYYDLIPKEEIITGTAWNTETNTSNEG